VSEEGSIGRRGRFFSIIGWPYGEGGVVRYYLKEKRNKITPSFHSPPLKIHREGSTY